MRQGEVKKRCDSYFHKPEFRALEKKLLKAKSLKRLRDLATSFTNGDHGGLSYVDTGVRYLRGQSITEYGLDLEKDELYVSEEDHIRMIRAEVIPGDVVLTIAGSIGNACVIKGIERANINQAIVKIRPSDEILSDYLALFLNSHLGKFQTERLANGAVQLNVNFSETGDINIVVPSLKTQRALVSEMEAALAKRQSMLAEAEKLFTNIDDIVLPKLGIKPFNEIHRSVYAIRLGETDNRLDAYANQPRFHYLRKTLKEKYSAIELSSIALDIFSGTTPLAGGDAYTDEGNGIPFVRSGEITSDGLVSENHDVFLKPLVHERTMKRSQLKQDDLLIAIVGATIGSVGIYKSDKPANINQAIAAVRLPTDKVLPEFVSWYLKSSVGQGMLDFLKRPVARANINLEEIGQILVPIPTLAIQKEIIKNVETRRAQARQLRKEAERQWQEAKEKFEKALLG